MLFIDILPSSPIQLAQILSILKIKVKLHCKQQTRGYKVALVKLENKQQVSIQIGTTNKIGFMFVKLEMLCSVSATPNTVEIYLWYNFIHS